ncbi:MAG TPA: efflux transporter outer membrane subunit [Burkholderiales bacterium]|nr:efflux transporter outer membrane subunit [Burkholderiales bacterium]
MNRFCLLFLLIAAGCSVAPRYERPALDLPQAWKESAPPFAQDGRWWKIYGDAQLDALVEEAEQKNADVALAVARVDEARALVGETESGLYPSVSAQGSATRQQISQKSATFFPGIPQRYSDYRAALNVSWELDLFGRIRSGVEAARADAAASEAARDAVRLSLAAQVAKSYFTLRALDEQILLTRRTLSLREDALGLQKKRFEGGVLSEFDYKQLEADTASTRATLPPLERDREREEAALLVLLGRSPKEVFESAVARKTAENEEPSPPVLPSGMPSELLLRRPDLVQAEQGLIASNARIGVARAEMFPSISLTAALGSESAALGNLFSSGSGLWALGLGLAQPIFAGGRLEARTREAEARERQALAQYGKAIQNAFSEVRAALAAQTRERESYEAQSVRAAALADTLRLARLRYDNGIASQLDVIDAERGLLAARSARIEALRAHRAAIADLFRALGG